MPAGLLVTVPLPVPDLATASVAGGNASKVATTDVTPVIVTTQDPVPEHPPPDQPANVEPTLAVAVRATTVPTGNDSVQSLPHDMATLAVLTVPDPEPAFDTVSITDDENVAVTVALAASVVTHSPTPVQPPPLQPVNAEPGLAKASSVTT
jgi:hypothetical protein